MHGRGADTYFCNVFVDSGFFFPLTRSSCYFIRGELWNVCVREIFALAHSDLQSDNIWCPKCVTILSFRWWRWPSFPQRIHFNERDAIWNGRQNLPPHTKTSPTAEELASHFFCELPKSGVSHVICPISTNLFWMCCVLVAVDEKCKYSLSHFVYMEHMWRKISSASAPYLECVHRMRRIAETNRTHLFLLALSYNQAQHIRFGASAYFRSYWMLRGIYFIHHECRELNQTRESKIIDLDK